MLLHRSPALTAIYNEIRSSERNRVLDLGPMSQGCFQLFSELSCKIQVENIVDALREHLRGGGEGDSFPLADSLGVYSEQDKFDVILVWDLLNYLNLRQIKDLFAHLQPHCKPNTLIYMLRYVEKKIPLVPRSFLVKDKYLLEVRDGARGERSFPPCSTIQLLSAMPGCFMQDTLMGQTGMLPGITEHVVRFTPNLQAKHRISKSEASRAAVASEIGAPIARRHHSPAIAEVMSLLQTGRDLSVLDLGAPSNRAQDAVVKTSEAYYRVDLHALIERSQAKGTDLLNLSVFGFELTRTFDVILAWDLFSYCSAGQLLQLDAMLATLSHEHTFLLSYMYTGRLRPARPSRFEVISGNQVLITATAAPVMAADNITGVSLMRLLQSFNMDKTYAYRDGMDREIIEYIFASKSTALAPYTKPSAHTA